MRYFPLFLDLRGRPVLVVGGGAVAERKVRLLVASGALVTVVAPRLCTGLAQRAARGEIAHRAGEFAASDLDAQRCVIAATDQAAVNREVAAAAEARGLFVNVVDDAGLSSAIMPAIVDRSPLMIAISSGGAAPMLARRVREQLETLLDQSWGRVAQLLGLWRARIRARFGDSRERRAFYRELLDGPLVDLVRRGRDADAEQALDRRLAEPAGAPRTGSVILVGAGPGDPGLLTLRALRALNEADVVLHDRLVSAEVLAMVRRDAELLDVGKVAGGASVSQDLINRMLVAQARAGRKVVRLKGGDPFIFGRGGEELEYLRAAGVAYECVPGVTAALACAATAGIPLTHRDHSRAVRLVAAHQRDHMTPADWDSLATSSDTLVVYMVVAGLGEFCAQLLRRGRSASTPAAVIENGTRPEQRVLLGQLDGIAALAAAQAVASPALLVVGEVAALGATLHWFGAAPISSAAPDTSQQWRAVLPKTGAAA
jgi:uroporphyrin-III C-methyltransferase / precorrin-2 dehydrogenase / sirohydrochlorin ferrochelatase